MKTITVDELVEKLKKLKNEYITIILEGTVEEKINIDFCEINKLDDFIEIVYEKTKHYVFGKKLKINIKRIEKIKSDEDTEFYIYLAGGQKVIFFTDINVLINYKLFKFANKDGKNFEDIA